MDTKFSHTHSLLNTLSEGSDPCLDGEELGWSEQPFFRATGGTYFFGAPSSPQDDGLDHHFQMDKFAYVREGLASKPPPPLTRILPVREFEGMGDLSPSSPSPSPTPSSDLVHVGQPEDDNDRDIDQDEWALSHSAEDEGDVCDLIPGFNGDRDDYDDYYDDDDGEDEDEDEDDGRGARSGTTSFTLALADTEESTAYKRAARTKKAAVRDPEYYDAPAAPAAPARRVTGSASSAGPVYVGGSSVAGHNEAAAAMLSLDADADRKRFWCTFPGCTMRLSRPSHLEKHMRTHTNERPHACPQCDMAFKTKWTLKKHIRTHTGEKPFGCEYPGCNKAFTQRGTYRRHQRLHAVDAVLFTCPCGKTFKQRSNFNMHVQSHAETTEHRCQVCSKTFKSTRSLDKHRLLHATRTPDGRRIDLKKLYCRYCAKAFHYAPLPDGTISAESQMDFAAHEQSHTATRLVVKNEGMDHDQGLYASPSRTFVPPMTNNNNRR